MPGVCRARTIKGCKVDKKTFVSRGKKKKMQWLICRTRLWGKTRGDTGRGKRLTHGVPAVDVAFPCGKV